MNTIDAMTTDLTGMWRSASGEMRKLLLPNGRYLAMGGGAPRQGSYVIAGARIEYVGDDGSEGVSVYVDGELRSAKGVFYPEDMGDALA